MLTDKASVVARWQDHFTTLLSQPLLPPPLALLSEAAASKPDPLIDTFSPMLIETHKAANKTKAGKASGSSPSCRCIITAFYPSSCTALIAEQSPREMHTRLMLSINGVQRLLGIKWYHHVRMWDRQPNNHTFWLLSKHDVSLCSATLHARCNTC